MSENTRKSVGACPRGGAQARLSAGWASQPCRHLKRRRPARVAARWGEPMPTRILRILDQTGPITYRALRRRLGRRAYGSEGLLVLIVAVWRDMSLEYVFAIQQLIYEGHIAISECPLAAADAAKQFRLTEFTRLFVGHRAMNASDRWSIPFFPESM